MASKYKHLHNDFFMWMEGIYGMEHLTKSAETAELDWWDVYWADDPSSFYGFTAYVFWKTKTDNYGYEHIYYYSYDDTTMRNSYGPFTSLELMKQDYETDGGYDMKFPADLTVANGIGVSKN